MKTITTNSTSRASAQTDDLVLRQTETTRLIFRPLLVDNQQNEDAVVKGSFLFQKKGRSQQWENTSAIKLNELKAGDGVKLELKSAEILNLYQQLSALYNLVQQEGIPYGQNRFVQADKGLLYLLQATDVELAETLDKSSEEAFELLSRVLRWIIKHENPLQIVQYLEQCETSDLQQLSSVIGLTALKASYAIWEQNKENADEEFWQETLSNYSFVLSQIFAYPTIIIKQKAYVGGKNIENTGGNLVDFLAQNDISKNSILIEIKTPKTKLLGSLYRNNVYSISSALTGSIVQVANYKHSLEREFLSLKQEFQMESFNPPCIVVAGNYSSELRESTQKKTFELFRSSLQGIMVITYDELFEKVNLLISLLEGNSPSDDDIPF